MSIVQSDGGGVTEYCVTIGSEFRVLSSWSMVQCWEALGSSAEANFVLVLSEAVLVIVIEFRVPSSRNSSK